MGFSVDYVVNGRLPTAGQVVWIVESARGGAAQFPVRLQQQGNLSTFAQGAKPEHGPFQCYLAIVYSDGRRTPISRKVEMQSVGH